MDIIKIKKAKNHKKYMYKKQFGFVQKKSNLKLVKGKTFEKQPAKH